MGTQEGQGALYSRVCLEPLTSTIHKGCLHTKNISYIEILINNNVKTAINPSSRPEWL